MIFVRSAARLPRQQPGCGLAIAIFLAMATTAAAQESPWKKRVDALVQPLVDDKKFVGLVVGISTADGKREFFTYGKSRLDGDEPTPDTIFEIGSITKPITALLLALFVEAGQVKLDDPVQTHAPKELEVPKRGDRDITLVELATHTSGLPRLPGNLALALMGDAISGKGLSRDPYSQYDFKELTVGLKGTQLKDVAEPKVSYSNFGAGLLGEILSKKADVNFETLVRTRIAEPLGMKNTFIAPTEARRAKMAKGYDAKGEPSEDWMFVALAGAGAVRSTAADMLTLLEAENGRRPTKLDKAIRLTQESRKGVHASEDICLGWFYRHDDSHRFWWHNGGTGGFASFAGFSRDPAVAVVVLSNKARDSREKMGVDPLGVTILRELIDAGKKESR